MPADREDRGRLGKVVQRWKLRVRLLRQETTAIYLAYRDPGTPWYAKVFAACVVGYALSPIDLIPDFIPVLGYLDDLVLVPLGILVVLTMIPPDVMTRCREIARSDANISLSKGWPAAVIIVAIWLAVASIGAVLAVRALSRR